MTTCIWLCNNMSQIPRPVQLTTMKGWLCLLLLLYILNTSSQVVQAVPKRLSRAVNEFQCSNEHTGNRLCIAAFNIEKFGRTKMNRREVVDALVKIIRRYDIVLIEEILGNSRQAINELLQKVNVGMMTLKYKMKISEPLGETSYKERYAFFYRVHRVNAVDIYQYPRNQTDNYRDFYTDFVRPPFAVKFSRTTAGGLQTFTYAGIHTKPEKAATEIDNLIGVYNVLRRALRTQDIIIGGDFNAGCDYFTPAQMARSALKTDPNYRWVIGDDAKTNVAPGRSCPYDRLVLAGNGLQRAYLQDSGTVYTYDDQNYDRDLIKKISDHYPIQMLID